MNCHTSITADRRLTHPRWLFYSDDGTLQVYVDTDMSNEVMTEVAYRGKASYFGDRLVHITYFLPEEKCFKKAWPRDCWPTDLVAEA